MKITKHDRAILFLALRLAIDYEDSLIDCHWNSITKKHFDTKTVNRCRRNIRKFKGLIEKLREGSDAH